MSHVLLVDDHPELLVTVAEALRALGFTVTEAMTRAQANALLAGKPFDIVVTDSVLRGGNGDDVAKTARRIGVPVIIISGDPECAKRFAIGDLPFLAKPFYSTQLAELINRVIAAKS